MGVKYAREYKDIINDFASAIVEIEKFYEFLYINDNDWTALDNSEQKDCIKTLCDDIFYALNDQTTLDIGNGTIKYDSNKHNISLFNDDKLIKIISLI